jgi:methylase of polypeptide subunit release factors
VTALAHPFNVAPAAPVVRTIDAYPVRDTSTDAMLALGSWLASQGYAFTTTTPDTHQRVVSRAGFDQARDLRGAFGWNLPFSAELLPSALLRSLQAAQLILPCGSARWRSTLRWSSLDGRLYVHGAFPTTAADSVFFGPDTYRFAALIQHTLATLAIPPRYIVDIGCGSGAGGLIAQRSHPAARLVLADINAAALRYAAVNAALADQPCETVLSDVLAGIDGEPDCIVSNPPYMADPAGRAYRDGGAEHGAALSLRILAESLQRLAAGGTLVLYTGSAIIAGEDRFRTRAAALIARQTREFRFAYREIDPDVFGEELSLEGYRDVERIAAVGLVVHRATHDSKDPPA